MRLFLRNAAITTAIACLIYLVGSLVSHGLAVLILLGLIGAGIAACIETEKNEFNERLRPITLSSEE